jgi:hypothetical protein
MEWQFWPLVVFCAVGRFVSWISMFFGTKQWTWWHVAIEAATGSACILFGIAVRFVIPKAAASGGAISVFGLLHLLTAIFIYCRIPPMVLPAPPESESLTGSSPY